MNQGFFLILLPLTQQKHPIAGIWNGLKPEKFSCGDGQVLQSTSIINSPAPPGFSIPKQDTITTLKTTGSMHWMMQPQPVLSEALPMTDMLFQLDSYIRDFDAVVTGHDPEGNGVLLNRTAFYPGGGGQPCDLGTLNAADSIWQVARVRKVEGGILHFLEGGQPLPAQGTAVRGSIDWDRRYALMRTHTALHILCGVVFRDYGALVTGGDMEPLKGRMDFEFETLGAELVSVIEQAVNAEVAAAHPVKVAILPRQEAFQIPDLIRTKINLLPPQISEVRTVQLVGLDLQADGGTHVANTSEIGRVRVTDYKSKGRINKRIYIELG
jgi:misacylated tRNA(Ala) deacylase